MNGKIFLKDTVSANRTGIVRIYDTTWNASIIYGWIPDTRDGKLYRSVTIGNQVWMAQNLNYRNDTSISDTVGVCYSHNSAFCSMYGRIYTWAEVMAVSKTYNSSLLITTSEVQGICPSGWHVPSHAEWTNLIDSILIDSVAGTDLKAQYGWKYSGNGLDSQGFRTLPAGNETGVTFNFLGNDAYFWSISEFDGSLAWSRNMQSGGVTVSDNYENKTDHNSLRCLQN
jgi:uncharacterized protein (TIGR02145 family)